jgi:ABC-type siderophore export system fused ATPase/permease subunit
MEDATRIAPLILLAPQLAYNALLAAFCLGYLATISLSLLGILSLGLALVLLVLFILDRNTREQLNELRKVEEGLFEHFRSISDGKKEMTMMAGRARHFTETLLRPSIYSARAVMTKVHLSWGLSQTWSATALYGAVFSVVYVADVALSTPADVTIPFVVGALFLSVPLTSVVAMGREIGTGVASLRHIESVGLSLRSRCDGPAASDNDCPPISPSWKRLRFDNVSYRYPSHAGAHNSAGPISLEIRRGEILFITGPNGSGKSTLLLLILGLLRPATGQILIDDQPLGDIHLNYRNLFTGVFSDSFLFSHVLDASGTPTSDDRIEALLGKLKLGPQVQVLESRLSRLTLSTGQRKRISLLQCYAEDREIFYFDEWAADQDPQFREHFYCELLPELKSRGKTVVAISHDEEYFALADRVIKLHHGVGAPDDLTADIRSASPDRARQDASQTNKS